MRLALAAFVFILALGLGYRTVASELEVCTAEKTDHCTEKKEVGHHTEADSKEEKVFEKMNSLFPERQKNAIQSERPLVVKLTAPQFLAKISGTAAKLEWSVVQGATHYHVQVATDPNFKWLVANDYWVKTNSFNATSLEPDRKYYWRVASIKDTNDAMFTKSVFVSSLFSTSQ